MTGGGEARGAESSDVLFFYCQEDPNKSRSLRRPKKVLDEQTLLTLSPKKNLSSLAKLSQELDPNASLADRLAAILKVAAPTSSMVNLPNIAKPGASFSSPSRSQIEWDNSATLSNTFTDTRLQAIRYLTEDMIRELDETVMVYAESEVEKNLALPAQVICDWHADWTDLTERADYSRFPIWQTKNGKEASSSSSITAGGAGAKSKKTGNKKDLHGTKKTTKGFRRNSSMESPETILEEHPRKQSKDRASHASNKPPNKLMTRQRRSSSKVSSIMELNTGRGGLLTSRAGNQRASAMKNLSPSSLRPGSINNHALLNKLDLTSSRVMNSQNSTMFSLNYQLSNKVYREKGWTVLKIEREETDHLNERRIVDHLNSSLQSINECRNYNEQFGLINPCKIRFYGDHRKDQIEKYKSTHSKTKKSAFAMSILRYEIPRPLDLQYMLDVISNPNLVQLAALASTYESMPSMYHQSLLATAGNKQQTGGLNLSRPGSSISSVSFTVPKPPPLLSTHTNDGTTCIYYPNGQLAVIVANVFGFFIESASSSSAANANQNLYQTAQSMFSEPNTSTSKQNNQLSSSLSGGGSSTMTNYNLCLKCQPLKNSFTTIVYDRQQPPPRQSIFRAAKESLTDVNNLNEDKSGGRRLKPSSREKQRLLCVISSLGYCVVYRNNGLPRFICSEYGGCLCNRSGNVYYQWKWDEVKLRDYERFKNELLINLNENVRLEYRNPSNIRLKFTCDKETHEFDLGCTKQNSTRLHEMLNRTVCDFPMQSKLGQIKLATNAKSAILQTYKQHHAQQQQHAAHSIRKVTSLVLNQSFRGSKNPSPSDEAVESLLESMVSYRDVPAMKDLLTTQKKIRNLLDEWLNYCRTSLNIMQPEMYILPELRYRPNFGRMRNELTQSPLLFEWKLFEYSSGKLLLEALCNLFCSSKSNMVQYLIGSGGGNLFETAQSHRTLIELVEKMIELSSSLDAIEHDSRISNSSNSDHILENQLILSLVDWLNLIQSNIFFKLKTCLAKLYPLSQSSVYENAIRFVLDYANLLIRKSHQLIDEHKERRNFSSSFLINCFFTKLVYNFILWLSETLNLYKLSMATKLTKIFISFYELGKLLQKRTKIEETEKCLKTWTFDSKNKSSIFDLVINYSYPLATHFVIEFESNSVLAFSESTSDPATYLFIDSCQKSHTFLGKLGSATWKPVIEIKSNSSIVFSIRSNKDLKSSSLFNLKFTVRAYGYEKSLQRVDVYGGELVEAVEATLGAHLCRIYSHRMNPHDFEFDDENIKRLMLNSNADVVEGGGGSTSSTTTTTTTAAANSRLTNFDSDFYRIVLRGGRQLQPIVDVNLPDSPVDDDARLWRFLRKVARFLEDDYEPEPMVSKFVEMYDPQIKSFNKLGGKSFNDLLIRLVCSMLWLNPSVHFSDLFTIYDESLQTQSTTKPRLNSHVLAAFKFVESTRITVVRQQQQNNINQANTTTNKAASLIESMRKRADYLLLGIGRVSESLLTYETLIRQRVEQHHRQHNQPNNKQNDASSDHSQTTTDHRKSSLSVHQRTPLPKCDSHPIYSLIFEFAFDYELDPILITECLVLKRANATILCENFDLIRTHLETSFVDLVPANNHDDEVNQSLVKQHLELVLILLSNFFSTWSRGQFIFESNSSGAGAKKPSKSIDSAPISFPPSLKFKPNNYLESFYGCGLDVEAQLRASYYGFLKCLLNYSSKIRCIANIERQNSCLNSYVMILLSIDWDLNDIGYLNSSNLNVIDYLVENCVQYMPITSQWSRVVVDAARHKTPSDLLEELFSLSKERFQDAVNKQPSGGEKKQLAMLEEVDEEDEEGEATVAAAVAVTEEENEMRKGEEIVDRPLFDSESFDLNLFPRMYHIVFGSGSTLGGSSKFDTESLIKCLTFDIKSYEQYEKYIVARYMFWKYFSKLKTNFYCDSCSIILTSNRYVCLECRDHCFCTSCFVKSMISTASEPAPSSSSSSSSDPNSSSTSNKKNKKRISFVNPSGVHRPSHRMLLLDHVCDQCNSLIIGKRVNCRSCVDYDLCLSCHRDILSHTIKQPSKSHKSDHSVDIHEPIIVVAKSIDVTNTQVFLYLQSQMLYSTLALKSALLNTTIRKVGQEQQLAMKGEDDQSRLVGGIYKQAFKSLLNMISASKSASLSSTNLNDRLGVFAFYNQESIIGLLACLVKLMYDDCLSSEMSELSSISLVKFVLGMLKDNESFDNDVCIMLVNVLGILMLKCDPTECDSIAQEIFVSTKEDDTSEGENNKTSAILEFIVDSIESFMQIDQITTVIAYLNLLFKLDAGKWRAHISKFLSSLLDKLLVNNNSNASSTKLLLRSHTLLHALTFAADSSIFNGVWIEFKSESLYDGAGILRSNPDFKLGLTRIFYCDSYSQYPLTYFISLIEPETRKIINLKAQKFEVHFRKVGAGVESSRLKLRSHFTLDSNHIVQIEQLIKRLVSSSSGSSSSSSVNIEGKRAGSSHSLRAKNYSIENSIETTTAENSSQQFSQPNLKQYEIVHVNKKRRFATKFGQMRLSLNWLLNCLVNMLKNGFSDIILQNEYDVSKLEAACSDQEFLGVVYKMAFLSTQLNPYWKLSHLRKFLGNLYFFEENSIVRDFVEYELETTPPPPPPPPTTTTSTITTEYSSTIVEQEHEKRASKQQSSSEWPNWKQKSSITIAPKINSNVYYTCEDLKLTADKQIAILGICEASNSYMFKSHELNSFSDVAHGGAGGEHYSRNKQSLALLENCIEKLTKFDSASFSIPKSSSNVNPLARPTNNKSMNDTIKSVMRLISNAIIVLSSREMLVQLIKMCNKVAISSSLSSSSSSSLLRQHQLIHLPPEEKGVAVSVTQREYELLQLLDVLFYTDTLSTYKSIVVKTLLSAAASDTVVSSSSDDIELIISRMACVHMLPEFKLVKRENWSSMGSSSVAVVSGGGDEKQPRMNSTDRGLIRRQRPVVVLYNGLTENAVQFASSSSSTPPPTTTAAGLTFGSSQTSTFSNLIPFKHSDPDFIAAATDPASSSKPGDIERLTNSDLSNLLVVFDLNKTSINANKPNFNSLGAFKRPARQLGRLVRQSRTLWLVKNAAQRLQQSSSQQHETTTSVKQEPTHYTDDFESTKDHKAQSSSSVNIQEAEIETTTTAVVSTLKPIPARAKKLLSKRAELGDEGRRDAADGDEYDEDNDEEDKYDIDQEDDDMIMTTRKKPVNYNKCFLLTNNKSKARSSIKIRAKKCYINFQLVSKRKDPNDPRNMNEYGDGEMNGENGQGGGGDDVDGDEDDDDDESESNSENNSTSSREEDDEDDEAAADNSDVDTVDDNDSVDNNNNDKSSMDSYDETDDIDENNSSYESLERRHHHHHHHHRQAARRLTRNYKWNEDEYGENDDGGGGGGGEENEDEAGEEDEDDWDEEMNTDADADELEWFEVGLDGGESSSAAAHATTNYHHGRATTNDSDSDDNKYMRTNFRVAIDQVDNLPYLAFHNQRTLKWKFSRRPDNDWATLTTAPDTCSFKIYSAVSRNFESSYHILDELIEHMELSGKQTQQQHAAAANNLWLHLIHAACVQTFTYRLKLLGLLVKMIKRVYYHHQQDEDDCDSTLSSLPIDLFALKPLKSLHYTLETYYKLDHNLSRALYELFYFAEKLAIKFHVEREFVARLRDKQELVKKFCETACIVSLISASINTTVPSDSSSKHGSNEKATSSGGAAVSTRSKTVTPSKKTNEDESDTDDDRKKWCKKSNKPSPSSWSPPSLDLKVTTAKQQDNDEEEEDDDDDDEEEFFDGNDNHNDGECEEIDDDDDSDDDDDINSKLGDL